MILKYDLRGIGLVFANVIYVKIKTGGEVLAIEYFDAQNGEIKLSDSNYVELYTDSMKLIHKYK